MRLPEHRQASPIGTSELATVWTGSDFERAQRDFAYTPIFESPAPCRGIHDAFRYGIGIPEGVGTIHQERAYTSSSRYTPE